MKQKSDQNGRVTSSTTVARWGKPIAKRTPENASDVSRSLWLIRVTVNLGSVRIAVVVQVRLADQVVCLGRMVCEGSELMLEPKRADLRSVLKSHAARTKRLIP